MFADRRKFLGLLTCPVVVMLLLAVVLLAHPEVTVEIGGQTSQAIAKPVTGEEHDQIYARWAERNPQFRDYQEKTTRVIPVIELELHSA